MQRKTVISFYLLVFFFLTIGYFASGFSIEKNYEKLIYINQLNHNSWILLAGIMSVISVLLAYFSFPAPPLIHVSFGYLFGGLYGSILAVITNILGTALGFWFQRRVIPPIFQEHFSKIKDWARWLLLVSLKLSPFVPAPLVTTLAVTFGTRPLPFLTSLLVGGMPQILLYVELGNLWQQGFTATNLYKSSLGWYAGLIIIASLLLLFGPLHQVLKLSKLKVKTNLDHVGKQYL